MSETKTKRVEDSGNIADTYGWDTAFAINFSNANMAMTDNWSKVNPKAKNFNYTATDDPSYQITGVFSPWQLTLGGDGKNVRMQCAIESGTYKAAGQTYDFAGKNTSVIIEVGMEWVPGPDQFFFVVSGIDVSAITTGLDVLTITSELKADFKAKGVTLADNATVHLKQKGLEWVILSGTDYYYIFDLKDKDNDSFLNIYKFEKNFANNLDAMAKAVSESEPAVNIISIANDPATGIAAAVLSQLFSSWFNENIAEFNHVFAILDLSLEVDKNDKWKWIKPTSTSYAVTDEGTMESSIFGVLTMTENRDTAENHQVSPYAIPTGQDAGFLISGQRFIENMMREGASTVFNGEALTSFDITNDGLTVQNNKELTWGNFEITDSKKVTIKIPAKQFKMTLSHSQVEIEFINLNYAYSSDYNVHVNYTEYVQLKLKEVTDSNGTKKKIFWFDEVSKNMTVNVTKTDAMITREIVMGAVVAVLSMVALAGPIVEGLTAGAEVVEGVGAGAAEISEDVFEAAEAADPIANAEEDAEAGVAAGEDVAQPGKWQSIKNAFRTPKWKFVGGLAAAAGLIDGGAEIIGALIEKAAKDEWDDVKGFDEFSNMCIAPYAWPGVTSFDLGTSCLSGSLQIGLKTT